MAKTGSGAALRLIAFCFAPKMFTQVDRDILEEAKNKIKIENSFLSARKLHQMYMNCTKMYYHVWRQLQLIIHFGLPSPPHDNVVHSVPLSLGSHPFSHFHTLDYHKLTKIVRNEFMVISTAQLDGALIVLPLPFCLSFPGSVPFLLFVS